MENIRITTLAEDTALGNGLYADNELSYWIDCGDDKLLLGVGQTGNVVRNAEILEIDLKQAEAIVFGLEHSRGLEPVLNLTKNAKLYIPADSLDNGLPTRERNEMLRIIESQKETKEIIAAKEPTEIFPGLFVTGQVPRINDFETDNDEFLAHNYFDENSKQSDAIFFDTADGLVVMCDCASAGIINILDYITAITGRDEIYAVMGGMHLLGATKERISKVIENLKKFNPQKIGPAYCTGLEAALELRKAFPKKCFMCSVGSNFEFELNDSGYLGYTISEKMIAVTV